MPSEIRSILLTTSKLRKSEIERREKLVPLYFTVLTFVTALSKNISSPDNQNSTVLSAITIDPLQTQIVLVPSLVLSYFLFVLCIIVYYISLQEMNDDTASITVLTKIAKELEKSQTQFSKAAHFLVSKFNVGIGYSSPLITNAAAFFTALCFSTAFCITIIRNPAGSFKSSASMQIYIHKLIY